MNKIILEKSSWKNPMHKKNLSSKICIITYGIYEESKQVE